MLRPSLPDSDSPRTGPIAGLIGGSPAMLEVYATTRRVAASNASVLLLGETGTGKELIAKAIHALSPRGSGPFVRVNCGALSESLLESELFGHVRGAFTGAVANRTGRFEAAHTGTIFLDEINSTTLHLQVKLLRVLQEREFERVGDTETIRVDTRVIAASNRDLLDEVAKEGFREDLYYRLNVVPIVLPPLRSRREDIPLLVSHFLEVYNEQNDRYVVHIQAEALETLVRYHWPGNVRELQNVVERCVVMAPGDEITLDLLPVAIRGGRSVSTMPGRGWRSRQPGSGTRRARVGHVCGRRRHPVRSRGQPGGAGTDRPDARSLRGRATQGGRPAGHQPQHPPQETPRARPGRSGSGLVADKG